MRTHQSFFVAGVLALAAAAPFEARAQVADQGSSAFTAPAYSLGVRSLDQERRDSGDALHMWAFVLVATIFACGARELLHETSPFDRSDLREPPGEGAVQAAPERGEDACVDVVFTGDRSRTVA